MKKLLTKYIEIYTAFTIIVCALVYIKKDKMSFSKKINAIMLFISCLHCWEESKWAGGYFDLILNKNGLKGKVDDNLAYTVLTDLPLVMFGISWAKDKKPFNLAFSAMGIFEMVSHTAGIKMYNTDKPYVPGMYTSWVWGAVALYNILKK